jgi:hypothetical protein
MLLRIVDIVNNSESRIEDGTLFCNNYKVSDKDCLDFLEEKNAFENNIPSKEVGMTIDLELSLAHLNPIGFYQDYDTLIIKNKFDLPRGAFFVYSSNILSTESNLFFDKYKCIIRLISSIEKISKHSYIDVDIKNLIISREDKSAFLQIIYNANDIQSISENILPTINNVCDVFDGFATEKKLLFINELIDFLFVIEEADRFNFLILNIDSYFNKSENAYQFYLRDFSYNKLKIEIDSKALEFTQKIQSVINDSQTKLIAIPTAFVLVAASLDFKDLISVKNIFSIISLFIFSFLIQLFLNNQRSALNFINENIKSYKESFKKNEIQIITSKFNLVEDELLNQRRRIYLVEIILWVIPISLVLLFIFLWKIKVAFTLLVLLLVIFDSLITYSN